MKPISIILLLVYVAGCTSESEDPPNTEEIWPLIAQSHLIVTGTLTVPVERIRSCLESNEHTYVEFTVTSDQTLKGEARDNVAVRWFTEPRDYAPHPERLLSFDGKKALLFLVEVDDPHVRGWYFAGYTPNALFDPDPSMIHQVRLEVAAQEQLLTRFEELFPPEDEPLYGTVKDLIDSTTRKDSQADAFRRLEALGEKAVPAIIMLMDDRRDLAVQAITLQNDPDHWEAVRHYSPAKVVDAMAAILNQITGHGFGSIYSSGTERERQAAVNGWRIFLCRSKNATDNRPTEVGDR